jgi:hypothetical protein
MDLKTPNSLVYSYRLAVIDEVKLKKQRNIVIPIIVPNTRSRMPVTLVIEPETVSRELKLSL